MRVIRSTTPVQQNPAGCVATIGNFDGVHRGHQQVIGNVVQHARALQLPVVVILFEPHPLEYLKAEKAPSRLTRLREKMLQLSQLPVDQLLVLRFDAKLASMNPEDFVRRYLVESLAIRLLVVGDDFRFGKQRKGNFSLLETLGRQHNFQVVDTTTCEEDGQRISSTAIRSCLEAGELQQAAQLLGREYSMCGRVVRGDGRGRELGFPTANVHLKRKKSPLHGVYAVQVHGLTQHAVNGVANIGSRPTFAGSEQIVLETHLFNFSADIYGKQVEVVFRQRIRDEQKFSSLEQLCQQITDDITQAQRILAGG